MDGSHKRSHSGGSQPNSPSAKRHKPHHDDDDDLEQLLGDYPMIDSPDAEADLEKKEMREQFKKKCEHVTDVVWVQDLLKAVQNGAIEGSEPSGAEGGNGHSTMGGVQRETSKMSKESGTSGNGIIVKDSGERDVLFGIMFWSAQHWAKPLKIYLASNLSVICDVFGRAITSYKEASKNPSPAGSMQSNRAEEGPECVILSCIRLLKRLPIDKESVQWNKKTLMAPIKDCNNLIMAAKNHRGARSEGLKVIEDDMNELLKRWKNSAMPKSRSASASSNAAASATPRSGPVTPWGGHVLTVEQEREQIRNIFKYWLLGEHPPHDAKKPGSPFGGLLNKPGTPGSLSRGWTPTGGAPPWINLNGDSTLGGPPGGNGAHSGRQQLSPRSASVVNPKLTPKNDWVAEVPADVKTSEDKKAYSWELVWSEMEKMLVKVYGAEGPNGAVILTKDYRQHGKMLINNIRNEKNGQMRYELLNTDVDLEKFVQYDSGKLAPLELQREREKAELEWEKHIVVKWIETPDLTSMADLHAFGSSWSSTDLTAAAAWISAQAARPKSPPPIKSPNPTDYLGAAGSFTPFFMGSVATPLMVFDEETDNDILMKRLMQC